MPTTSTFDKVVELINDSALTNDVKQKVSNLQQVKELIVHKEKDLLDGFLEEILQFQNDKNPKVREAVVSFIEESCKADPSVLPRTAERLSFLMDDDSTVVVKRVISSMMSVYRVALTWAARSKGQNKIAMQTYGVINELKEKALKMQHAPNDGLRMLTLKLMEVVIIIQSRRHPESYIPAVRENDISLDQIPEMMHRPLKIKKLEEEARRLLDEFLKFLGREDVSCVNLQTIMGSLTAIGKQRPQFMSKVVQGFETIHVNLPPSLAPTQVNSVRKSLKSNLLQILRHPASFDYQAQVTTLLTDLGATQSEVFKAMPKIDEMTRKRKMAEAVAASSGKKYRGGSGSGASGRGSGSVVPDVDLFDDLAGGSTPFISLDDVVGVGSGSGGYRGASDIDRTAADLIPKLNAANVTDLVLLSMVMLPEEMPPAFLSTYTPIAAAGTEAQIKHLARLLGAQLVAVGLGLGVDGGTLSGVAEDGDASPMPDETPMRVGGQDDRMAGLTTPMHISTVISSSLEAGEMDSMMDDGLRRPALLPSQLLPVLGGKMRQFKPFSLASVTQPLDTKDTKDMANLAYERIIRADLRQMALNPQVLRARNRLLSSLPCIFGGDLYNILVDYIMGDVRNRYELAISLVYQEFVKFKAFQTVRGPDTSSAGEYDRILIALLHRFMLTDGVKEIYFSRLFLDAPKLTENAFALLSAFCQMERSSQADYGFQILRQLILNRPAHRDRSLAMLLHLATHEIAEVRSHAMVLAQELYRMPAYHTTIEQFAVDQLEKLKMPQPVSETPHHALVQWNDDGCRCHLHLFLSLFTINPSLINKLSEVYVVAVANVKRAILRQIGPSVKEVGQHDPELLRFVEKFPKGSETLVIRVLHVVTDKASPSTELVQKVKDLYQRRVSDVRFLIPVLTGLSKTEVITYLPALIQLDDKLVKEVFSRLLGHHDVTELNAISPEELLISLHLMEHERTDSGKPVADLKSILRATQYCFAERRVYTQERLSIVLSQLIDEVPLPTLYMRTVMQSLGMYPRLAGYVTSILTRLITKQVWKNAALWEGFIRCCVKIRPQSYQVLLQLPANRLESVFQKEKELRQHLRHYVENFSAAQRSQISASIMELLEKEEPPSPPAPQNPVGMSYPPPLMDVVPALVKPLMEMSPLAASKAMKIDKERMEEEKRRQLRQRLEQDRQKLSFMAPGTAPSTSSSAADRASVPAETKEETEEREMPSPEADESRSPLLDEREVHTPLQEESDEA